MPEFAVALYDAFSESTFGGLVTCCDTVCPTPAKRTVTAEQRDAISRSSRVRTPLTLPGGPLVDIRVGGVETKSMKWKLYVI